MMTLLVAEAVLGVSQNAVVVDGGKEEGFSHTHSKKKIVSLKRSLLVGKKRRRFHLFLPAVFTPKV